jgi:hypothetical protein
MVGGKSLREKSAMIHYPKILTYNAIGLHATHSMIGFTVDERFVIMKCFKCYFGPHRQAPDGKREKCPREGNNTIHCLQMMFLINKCSTTIA